MNNHVIHHLLNAGLITEIATAQQAVEFDRHTINNVGVSAHMLMENAGLAVAKKIMEEKQRLQPNAQVVIFVGPGSNGADGVVAARHLLATGIEATLYCLLPESRWNPELSYQMELFKNAVGLHAKKPFEHFIHFFSENTVSALNHCTAPTILVDALFGAGLNRALNGVALQCVNVINELRRHHGKSSTVISVDIPSGLTLEAHTPLGAHVIADHTVTFGFKKRAHISEPTKAACGEVAQAAIGLFANSSITNYFVDQQRTLSCLLRPITKDSHKGTFGHVIIFEGDKRYLGASRLAARAALRVGAGLVTLVRTHETMTPLAYDLAEFMHYSLDDARQKITSFDALVIGPGVTLHSESRAHAMSLFSTNNKAPELIVMDAGALPLLNDPSLSFENRSIVATPHPKEAAQLLSCSTEDIQKNRFLAMEKLAQLEIGKRNQVVWVLKGATTLVRSPSGITFACKGELPLLASGGSGDVLSGAIAGLCKQTNSPIEATLLAVSLQIEAARVLSQKLGKGSLASELADLFPYLLKRRIIDES